MDETGEGDSDDGRDPPVLFIEGEESGPGCWTTALCRNTPYTLKCATFTDTV